MQVSVNLQGLIFIPIIFLSIGLLTILIVTIYILKNRSKSKIKKVPEMKKLTQEEKNKIKRKYIQKIDKLKRKLENEKIETRGAYQALSLIIRHFVYEINNIKVQNYSLEEIKKLNIQELCELIEEYYVPEFARKVKAGEARKLNRKNKKGNWKMELVYPFVLIIGGIRTIYSHNIKI